MNEHTYGFKILIAIDRTFNVLTLGDIGVTFSTRSHINAQTSKTWGKIESIINACFFDDNHCKGSFLWERGVKQKWLDDTKSLL